MIVADPAHDNRRPSQTPRTGSATPTRRDIPTMTSPPPNEGDLFNHPAWYDRLFADETAAEFHTYQALLQKHATRPVTRLFEPGCGSGRLLQRFADAGHQVAGCDISQPAIDFANQRLPQPTCVVADMTTLTTPSIPKADDPFDALLLSINTFRHLLDDNAALAFFASAAQLVRPGGLCLIDINLPITGPLDQHAETLTAIEGRSRARLFTWAKRVDHRQETFGTQLTITTPSGTETTEGTITYRTYTEPQIDTLLNATPTWHHRSTKIITPQERLIAVLQRTP